jgi:hypothetical protein
MFLFEALGYLVSNQLTKETIGIINEIVEVLLKQMKTVLSQTSLTKTSVESKILNILLLIKNFLKGFPASKEIESLFQKILFV